MSTGIFDGRHGGGETEAERGGGTAARRRRLLEVGALAGRRDGVRTRPQRPARPAARRAVRRRAGTDPATTTAGRRRAGVRRPSQRRGGVGGRQRLGLPQRHQQLQRRLRGDQALPTSVAVETNGRANEHASSDNTVY